MPSLLERVGLRTREQRAWASYDWAVSSMQTTIMAAVFPIYFVKVASAGIGADRGSQQLALANTAALVVVTLLSPVLGAMADHSAAKKKLLAAFALLGAAACAGMFFIERGDVALASVLYAMSMVGAQGSMAFYGALLPHIARDDEIDRLSTAGYALGYVGGGVLLAAQLLWITQPGWFGLPSGPGLTPEQATLPTRLALASVAVWWLAFSIPVLRVVPEPPPTREPGEGGGVWVAPFVRLGHTLHELRGFRQAALMLLAFMIYNDGISTIIKMATAYGTEIGIGQSALITAILVVQFVGIPCSFAFGALAGRIGAKRAVIGGLLVYVVIAVLGYYMRTATHFLVLALLVGLVQGGTQALSRSLFAAMVPPHRSGEFFGFYGVFEKFSGLFGPLLFALVVQFGGTSRQGILSVIVFFIVGTLLLSRVDVEAGQAYALEAERRARSVERGAA
ncbi:Autophagy-related protein 22-like protein [Gemmatirosa kalamazoonensis]|uniref:Autophagy-related protein 22-like protein n=1 Tax=Gemmatirosa kalamazoonensis TaxID=861299 RepID=W0RD39_9BACT|nr:MFS transporter [Gemmatirosa kalamazoonensis]AHG88691.1 Autophagy-related protein 22-like protein [Gemmatirosa kalamazoonensis]